LRVRAHWPRTRILLRADSGFARDDLMTWCEAKALSSCSNWQRTSDSSPRLRRSSSVPLPRAGAAAGRRVASRASCGGRARPGAASVMSLTRPSARKAGQFALCGHLAHARGVQAEVPLRAVYCARGDMENRIKECQLDLYADRTSAATMRANQLRPLVPLHGLCPAVRSAPDRPPRYRLRARDLRHHSSQAAQDRRARSHQRPSHQDRHGVSLSGRSRVDSCRLAIAALARASPA
jgi:hypothetical protein